MLVKGHSGFAIELVDELTVRKSATGSGAERLQRQIEKQIQFHKNSRPEAIHTPKVYRQKRRTQAFYADMEFIAARDFIQFLSEADRPSLDGFLKIITDFIRHNLAQSGDTEVSRTVQKKLADLAEKRVPAKYVRAAWRICRGPVVIPVGPCHGDLTLSNILFKHQDLYLLDFLDCFVESPLQDIVKLRQDTQFGWSLLLYQADFNPAKIQIALRYLDEHIEAAFRAEEWYRYHYRLFQLVNLMRVLPYCREGKMSALITGALDQMLTQTLA